MQALMGIGYRGYSPYSFLTSALDGGKWSAFRLGRALPPEKDPGAHWVGDWVSLRAGLVTETRGKILLCEFSFGSYRFILLYVELKLNLTVFKRLVLRRLCDVKYRFMLGM
jgi:hypothetical protein